MLLILWHNTEVGMGAVHVMEFPPIPNSLFFILVASHVYVTTLYLGHFRPLFYVMRLGSRDRCSAPFSLVGLL